ncbi:MAG: cation diffusion facilitator family transporter [Sulfurovum sp.]|nr:cation diffusion facilitator family transporter [Sulfurovum sp.]
MGHDHTHEVKNYNRSFAIGITLNIIFVIIEAVYGVLADSIALIADAGHNLSDVVGLLLAWGAFYLAKKHPSLQRTYGLRKVTILASLSSAILLLIAMGAIAWESVGRFSNPQAVDGMTVIVVAAIGVVINTLTALLFMEGKKDDLNIRGAYLHMAADAAVSLGVVIAGIAILTTGWLWLDPAISLAIVLVILVSTWGLLRDSFNLSVDAVPTNIDVGKVKNYLLSLDDITALHALHVWALSTTENALTVHLVSSKKEIDNLYLDEIQEYLHHTFSIGHSTIQIERNDENYICDLDTKECQI